MTDRELDALLRRALLDAGAEDWAKETEQPETQSRRQRRRMRALMADPRGYARRASRSLGRRVLRAAACLALVCAVALGGVLTLSPAVRAEVAQWVRTWTGRMVSYHFGGTPAQEELPWYEIGDPLEGYVKREREWNGDQTHTSVYYYNRAGERIWFSYDRMREDFALGMRTEGVEMEIQQVTVNGCPGDLYLIKDGSKSNVVIWMDQDAGIVFLIDAWASKKELLHMAESVDLVQTPK